MNKKISLYSNVFDTQSTKFIGFEDYLNGIKSGLWQDQVLRYRNNKTPENKKLLAAVTPAGWFEKRQSKALKEASGIINIDIDQKDNSDTNLIEAREELYADPVIYAAHLSVSGESLSLYIKINAKRHYDSFCAIEKHLADKYQIVIDQAAKDINRLRFVSYDPDLYLNKAAKKWVDYLQKEKQMPQNWGYDFVTSKDDFDFVLEQIKYSHVNLTEDYNDWLKIGFALASEFGESGRNIFHLLSSMSAKYAQKDTDEKYTSILKTSPKTSIKTFYWFAKNAGLKIKSPRTETIAKVAKIRQKQVGTSGGFQSKNDANQAAIKYLADVEGITGTDVNEIVETIANLSIQQLAEKSDIHARIEVIQQIVKSKNIRYNVVTQLHEADTKAMNDNDHNSLYIDCLIVDNTIKREFFNSVIFSNRIECFNPFLEFFEKNKHIKPSGLVTKLINTIKDDMIIGDEPYPQFKHIFLRKWLLSIIASVNGTYSLMIAVLTGKQMTEKTNFFRWLLPQELRGYYAESKLDSEKDDPILMTKKALICDDEFGGKSKQEAKKLKDLSSKQVFSLRRPYGRVHEDSTRIAVLCGTSNDDEVLNDPTGNRRIIPIKVISIDIESYKQIDKTELFMELYHEWKQIGEGWMLSKEEVNLLNKATIKHEQTIIEMDLIAKHYEIDMSFSYNMTSTEVKVYLESRTQQRLSIYKIGQSLTKLGYVKKSKKVNGQVLQIWNVRSVDFRMDLPAINDKLPF